MIENNNPNRKPIIYYILIAGAVIMLLNAFVFPSLLQRQVQPVGYSDFLNMIDAGQVTEVQLDENSNQLVFLAKDSNGMSVFF